MASATGWAEMVLVRSSGGCGKRTKQANDLLPDVGGARIRNGAAGGGVSDLGPVHAVHFFVTPYQYCTAVLPTSPGEGRRADYYAVILLSVAVKV